MQSKDAGAAVLSLRAKGVFHVEYSQPPKGKDLLILHDDAALLDQALEVLSGAQTLGLAVSLPDQKAMDWKTAARHTIDLWKRLDYLREFSKGLSRRIEEWELWGDFDPDRIRQLSERGVHVKLFALAQKEFSTFPADIFIKKLTVKAGIVYCIAFAREKIETPFKEVELPKMSLAKMKARLEEDRKVINNIEEEIAKCLRFRVGLIEAKERLRKEIEFQKALNGMGQEGQLAFLQGYAPQEAEASLTALAKKEKWGVLISDPAEEDSPPTLIRSPKWVSLVEPVYKLMEVVPGYRELDVSPLFLLFLSLFFGMIIGDAGYGAVYFTLTFLARRKYGEKLKDKKVFPLFYLFSFSAIMWGVLTGTYFGQQWYLARGFKALAPALNNVKFLMAFCFLLGAVQLSLAHAWSAIRKLPSKTAFADVGFICLLWAGFLLAKMFILGDAFPRAGIWLVWAGAALIVLFVSPKKDFLRTIGSGLGTLALGAMGNFGDVVSYIRLFAVGLAGVAVADSVNTLAQGAGGNIIARVLILFIGHSINIILGPMSVLVHGIRLNILEFSLLHGNVTWSGLAYKPLKE